MSTVMILMVFNVMPVYSRTVHDKRLLLLNHKFYKNNVCPISINIMCTYSNNKLI